jgi:hypothetical protein
MKGSGGMAMLKKIAFLCLGAMALSTFAEDKPDIVCGTGDALGGVDVYYNKTTKIMKVVLLSMADPPEGQDKSYTTEIDEESYKKILKGNSTTLIGRSPDSFDFGGATSKAILFNIKAHTQAFSYDRNALLAEEGSVFSLFCNKANLLPK